jgi:hypothetical protein
MGPDRDDDRKQEYWAAHPDFPAHVAALNHNASQAKHPDSAEPLPSRAQGERATSTEPHKSFVLAQPPIEVLLCQNSLIL